MELNISYIYNELNRIIVNKDYYNIETILYSLGAKEAIHILKLQRIVTFELIGLLKYLDASINVFIDFKLLHYMCCNKIDVNIILDIQDTLSISSSFESLDEKITKMIKKDSSIVLSLVNNSGIYDIKQLIENIDQNLIKVSKELFDMIDTNSDGFITALDIIKLYKFWSTSPFIVVSSLYDIVNALLYAPNNQLSFYEFIEYFV